MQRKPGTSLTCISRTHVRPGELLAVAVLRSLAPLGCCWGHKVPVVQPGLERRSHRLVAAALHTQMLVCRCRNVAYHTGHLRLIAQSLVQPGVELAAIAPLPQHCMRICQHTASKKARSRESRRHRVSATAVVAASAGWQAARTQGKTQSWKHAQPLIVSQHSQCLSASSLWHTVLTVMHRR